MIEMVLGTARRAGAVGIAELTVLRPLPSPARVRVAVGPLTECGHRRVTVAAHRHGEWVTHATGTLFDDPVYDAGDGFAGADRWPRRGLAEALERDGLVPVRWRGVEIRPTAVRARVEWRGRRARVWLAGEDGTPAGYVDEVELAEPAVAVEPVEHVHRLVYDEVVPTARAATRTVVDLTGRTDPVATTLEALTHARGTARELVFLIDDGLACAPVRGLVRSWRAECPEWTVRLVAARRGATAVAAAIDTELPEVVVDGDTLLVPRLVPARVAGGRPVLDRDGTVLVTGGTGELGGVIAMHLVVAHGIRHLVLVSRRGPDAPGATRLVSDLRLAGAASVRVVAADVADRQQVAAALSTVPDRHPLTAVVHLAGVLDDRLVVNQDAARFTRVLEPKVLGAWHLHELTRDRPLAAFVLFSSTASVFGSAGQSNYAAANAFLDALAVTRRADGLVATSVSWERWEQSFAGMSAHLGDPEVTRLRRQGRTALSARQGCRIFDAAIAQAEPHLVAAVLGPVPEPVAPVRDRLVALPAEQRWPAVVALVREEVAVVLGAPVGPGQVLGDAGVDSLMAVELRTRLAAATSVPLPATLVADHPTPNAIARVIMGKLGGPAPPSRVVAILGTAPPGVSAPETAWAALEHAGIVPKSLRGKRIGVYLAGRGDDVATRVAQLFGWTGPAVTVCGSPLVAVHLARTAVLAGECEVAVTGGDTMLVVARAGPRVLAVLTGSSLGGTGSGDLAEVLDAERRTTVRGAGAQVTVEPRRRRPARMSTVALPVVLSGRDHTALRGQAARWAEWLVSHPDTPLAGIARTAAVHRTHFRVRASILAASVPHLVEALHAVAAGRPHPDVVERIATRRTRLVFAYPDHSGQWPGIGRALLAESTAFAAKADECERVLRPGWSLLDAVIGDDDLDLDHPEVVRLANVTTQVSLAAALGALGLTPDAGEGPADEVVELRPFRGGVAELRRIVGTVHAGGYPVDWARALPKADLVDLPPYPFPALDEPPADPAGALQWALRIMEFTRTDLGQALLNDGP